jgi:hypothetical protein
MFPQQPQQQFRTAGADVKIFYGTSITSKLNQQIWNKPVGVSYVYMMLIGAGGGGDSSTIGGGSGGVTVWYGSARNIPDSLIINASAAVGTGTAVDTTVSARFSDSTALPTALLTAFSAQTDTGFGGGVMNPNQFTASGFFNSVAGVFGDTASVNPSSNTFLSGGGVTSPATANYGYVTSSAGLAANGYFQMQPIIVGVGGSSTYKGSIGCGGGIFGIGGQGMVLIASW